jgi:hypothetical protein
MTVRTVQSFSPTTGLTGVHQLPTHRWRVTAETDDAAAEAEVRGDLLLHTVERVRAVGQPQAEMALATALNATAHDTRDAPRGDVGADVIDDIQLSTFHWSDERPLLTTNAPVRTGGGNTQASRLDGRVPLALTFAADAEERAADSQNEDGQVRSTLKSPAHAEQVEVTIYPATIITCDGALEVDYENSKAIFHKNVHITDERGELFSDVMEVFFSPTKEIDRVIASGNVRIVRGQDTAYADEATYIQREGKMLLKGAPKLVIFPSGKSALN